VAGWIDGTYVVNAIGQIQAYRLGLVSTQSGAFTDTAALTQYEAGARGIVASVLVFAGYSPPSTLTGTEDCAGLLQRILFAVMIREVYLLRPGIAMPNTTAAAIGIAQSDLESIKTKSLPVPGLTPSAIGAVGGVQFSPAQAFQPFRGLWGTNF